MSEKYNEENENDDFLSKLSDPLTDTNIDDDLPNEKPKYKEKTFNEDMEDFQSTENRNSTVNSKSPPRVEKTVQIQKARQDPRPVQEHRSTTSNPVTKDRVHVEHKKEPINEKIPPKPVNNQENTGNKPNVASKQRVVEVVNSTDYKNANSPKPKGSSDVDFDDDVQAKLNKIYEEKTKSNFKSGDSVENAMDESVDSYLHNTYENDTDVDKELSSNSVRTTLISAADLKASHSVDKTENEEVGRVRTRQEDLYGGDGKHVAFKMRSSKISKTLRNIKVDDTSKIDPANLSSRSFTEQQNLYLKTVIPALKPCYSVTPLILSGIIITMTAFTWPDIVEICRLEEKIDDIDPKDVDYIYSKNKLFLEKRRKQLDLFYHHIYSVSGFPEVPDQETFYREIVKFPDFQQLFFAAYAASFQKPYEFTISCNTCGHDQVRGVLAKNLCFLLNKHINVDELSYLVETGSSISNNTESKKVYDEFQNNEFVQGVNRSFRSKKPLSTTAFVFELKIPSVYEAYETLDEIIEKFRDRPLEHVDSQGNLVTIDSSYNLPRELLELRNYMYISAILVPDPISEIGEDGVEHVKVGYNQFTDKESIIGTILNLGMTDYKEFVSDPNLKKMINLMTIQHAINAGICEKKSCEADMGIIPVEPEMLFFITAEPDLPD